MPTPKLTPEIITAAILGFAAIAVAFAVIRSCLARASSALSAPESVAELNRLNKTFVTHTRLLAAVWRNSTQPEATFATE